MNTTIFYAWQSDRPPNVTRNLVERALKDATKSIRNDIDVDSDPRVDRDTAGVPGSPDIVATIFEKIDRAAVFVADVTLVTTDANGRPSPNPNVLVELGYALKVLGWERMVLVMNTTFGGPDDLPFDIRQRRTMTFLVPEGDEQKAPQRQALQKNLEAALRMALAVAERTKPASPLPASPRHPADDLIEALPTSRVDRRALTRRYVERMLLDIDALRPGRGDDDEQLVSAINASLPIVEQFMPVATQFAVFGDAGVRDEIHELFEQLLGRFENPRGFSGSSFRSGFDFFKFLAHELFVVWIEAHLREKAWGVVDALLNAPLTVTGRASPDRTVPYAHLSEFTELLDRTRRQRLGTNRTSIHADMLRERYAMAPLAGRTSWQQFMEADYFLFLRSRIAYGSDWGDTWRPWSVIFLEQPPAFMGRMKSKKFALELAPALGARDLTTLGTELRKADMALTELFRSNMFFRSPCESFAWNEVASM
ncbi:MAG: hypothetical protein JNK05_11700 [Myxococcales bacterium]|nr:hypothetical protein [Myxococcales bacterium]